MIFPKYLEILINTNITTDSTGQKSFLHQKEKKCLLKKEINEKSYDEHFCFAPHTEGPQQGDDITI